MRDQWPMRLITRIATESPAPGREAREHHADERRRQADGLRRRETPVPQSPTRAAHRSRSRAPSLEPSIHVPGAARRAEADPRSDIFSFGAVVYEMVTGRPAFDGSSPASTMAAILEREPPEMTTLQQLTPPTLDHIVRRCLAKQPEDRWQSAGDSMRELKWVAETMGVASTTSGTPVDSRSTFARVLARALSWPALAAVLASALLFVLVRWSPWRPETTSSPLRFQVQAPRITSALATGFDSERRLVLSPDGTRIVYEQSSSQSRIGLMLQRLDQFDPVPLPGTANAKAPFFSPDGKWVGYYDQSSGELRKIAVEEEARRPFARSRVQSPARAGQSMTSWCSQPVWNARASKQARA